MEMEKIGCLGGAWGRGASKWVGENFFEGWECVTTGRWSGSSTLGTGRCQEDILTVGGMLWNKIFKPGAFKFVQSVV